MNGELEHLVRENGVYKFGNLTVGTNPEVFSNGGSGIVYANGKIVTKIVDRNNHFGGFADIAHFSDLTDKARNLKAARRSNAEFVLPNPSSLTITDTHIGYQMKQVHGESLEKLYEIGFDEEDELQIAHAVASLYEIAHQEDIIIYDGKPDNIMVEADEEWRAKMIDTSLMKPDDKINRSSNGIVLGTPKYMSPEQFLDNTVGKESDLYNLGGILINIFAKW